MLFALRHVNKLLPHLQKLAKTKIPWGFFKVSMAWNQKLSYKMNMFHFLTKQNYSKYSQISMSMSFSSSEASTMFRSSTASSTSESVIFSKGLSLFLSSRTDNCDFSCWRPAWQGSFGLKQWILSSSDPSFARFSAHDLNDSTITSFERAAHDSNIHWTIFFLGGGFMLPASVYWCTPSAIQWSYFILRLV